jgi:CDP-diacylglycerol--glycerol-3-phosphate 3-phosphatidyltransferase
MANIVTLTRFPLIFVYLAVLYLGSPRAQLWNTPLIVLIFILDGLDGWIARKRGETSLLGSVLDIATDRTLEYILWVVFAHLGFISILVPVIVIIRGTLVDAIRSIGMKSGVSAFEQLQSPMNRFLVSSRFMRAFYGAVKTVAAIALTMAYGVRINSMFWLEWIYQVGLIFTWISVITCLIRGFPVLWEGFITISTKSSPND